MVEREGVHVTLALATNGFSSQSRLWSGSVVDCPGGSSCERNREISAGLTGHCPVHEQWAGRVGSFVKNGHPSIELMRHTIDRHLVIISFLYTIFSTDAFGSNCPSLPPTTESGRKKSNRVATEISGRSLSREPTLPSGRNRSCSPPRSVQYRRFMPFQALFHRR